MKENRLAVIGGVAAVILILVAGVFLARGVRTGEVTVPGDDGATQSVEFTEDVDPVKGAKGAKVTIQEFSDFQCPACEQARPVLAQLFMRYGDDIEVEYESFPLPSHQWAVPTALLGECALDESVDKFWVVHDLLFDDQDEWSTSTDEKFVFDYAERAGLDSERFKACYESPETQAKVDNDIAEGTSLNINSTPSFFVDGERFVGSSYDEFSSLVESAIKKAK